MERAHESSPSTPHAAPPGVAVRSDSAAVHFLQQNQAVAATLDASTVAIRPELAGSHTILAHEYAHIAQLRSGRTALRETAERHAEAAAQGTRGDAGGAAPAPMFQRIVLDPTPQGAALAPQGDLAFHVELREDGDNGSLESTTELNVQHEAHAQLPFGGGVAGGGVFVPDREGVPQLVPSVSAGSEPTAVTVRYRRTLRRTDKEGRVVVARIASTVRFTEGTWARETGGFPQSYESLLALRGDDGACAVQISGSGPLAPYAVNVTARGGTLEELAVHTEVTLAGAYGKRGLFSFPPLFVDPRVTIASLHSTSLEAFLSVADAEERDRIGRGVTIDMALLSGKESEINDLGDRELAEMSVDQRMRALRILIEELWTGPSDEATIIKIVDLTPADEAAEFLQRLTTQKIDGETYFDRLDDVVNMGNNMTLHVSLTGLQLKGHGPEQVLKPGTLPVLPWHDVMGFFEDAAQFSAVQSEDGKIVVKYPVAVMQSKEFADEPRRLSEDHFLGGHVYEPNTMVVVHDYDANQFVPLAARDLIGYQNSGNRTFLQHAVTVASFAIPVGSAVTLGGKIAAFTLGRLLPAFFLFVSENRRNIMRWFPRWGPRILYFSDIAERILMIYNIAQLVRGGAAFFRAWRSARNARLALEGAKDLGEDAQSVAAQVERQSDEILRQVEELQRNAVPANDNAPISPAANDNALPIPANDTAWEIPEPEDLPLAAGGEGRIVAGPRNPRGSGSGTGRPPSRFTQREILETFSDAQVPGRAGQAGELEDVGQVHDRPGARLNQLTPKPPYTILAQALEEGGEPWPGKGFQPHHIIPVNDVRAAVFRRLLQRFDININSAENGVWLSTGAQTENLEASLRHEWTFRNSYFELLASEMPAVAEATEESVLEALARVKGRLKSGEPRLWLRDD